MDNIIKEGEQAFDGGNSNQDQSNNQGNNQGNDQGNDQQQSNNNNNSGGGGGFVSNTEDAYINNEANSFLTKEGLPSAADGVVDGALDTEVNKYKKDF